MMGIKLNAQISIKNLKNLRNMHEKSLPPTGARRRMQLEYQDWARLQGRARGRASRRTQRQGTVVPCHPLAGALRYRLSAIGTVPLSSCRTPVEHMVSNETQAEAGQRLLYSITRAVSLL
jgi:hypothetical protein